MHTTHTTERSTLHRRPNNPKAELCARLKQARCDAGFTTAKEFALKNDIKVSTYNLHEAGTRSMALEVIELYAGILKINMNWLLTGEGPKQQIHIRKVPIISWEEILSYPKNKDNKTKIGYSSSYSYSDVDLSPLSYALVVNNDAMEPRYPEGTVIIVEQLAKPQHKDFAIILLKDKPLPIFKQLVEVDGDLYAKSLNAGYLPIKLCKADKLLAKVVQAKLIF